MSFGGRVFFFRARSICADTRTIRNNFAPYTSHLHLQGSGCETVGYFLCLLGVTTRAKILQGGHLPRVIYHQVCFHTKIKDSGAQLEGVFEVPFFLHFEPSVDAFSSWSDVIRSRNIISALRSWSPGTITWSMVKLQRIFLRYGAKRIYRAFVPTKQPYTFRV